MSERLLEMNRENVAAVAVLVDLVDNYEVEAELEKKVTEERTKIVQGLSKAAKALGIHVVGHVKMA